MGLGEIYTKNCFGASKDNGVFVSSTVTLGCRVCWAVRYTRFQNTTTTNSLALFAQGPRGRQAGPASEEAPKCKNIVHGRKDMNEEG